MIAVLLNSKILNDSYKISFSFNQSESYCAGLKKRVKGGVELYPISFPVIQFGPNSSIRLFAKVNTIILNLLIIVLRPLFFLIDLCKLFRLFKEIKPDILHINNGGYPGALSAIAASVAGRISGVPIVIMVVNNMAVRYLSLSRWVDFPIDCLVSRSVNLFITGSKAASNRLAEVLNLPNAKICALPNGIFIPTQNEIHHTVRRRLGLLDFKGTVFGVVAHLIPRKGHIYLLQAVKFLIEEKGLRGDVFKILIEGSGPLKRNLEDYVVANNLSEYVIFVGNEKEIFEFISNLDVLILPSISDEDFPNVNLEAMAFGKAVISSNLAGTSEQILPGKTGFLVEPANALELASAMLYLIKDPERMALMGQFGKQRFETNFTHLHAIANYNETYKKLLGIKYA